MSEKERYVTLKIPEELAGAIDNILGKMGFRTRAEFAKEAIRHLLQQYPPKPLLEHFNMNEDGVLILDRTLHPNRIIEVYFKPDGASCELCESSRCRHVEFALSIPRVQEILRKKGWKMAEE